MAIACVFITLVLARRGFNPGALVVAGDQFANPAQVPLPVEKHSAGYDGQFYYRLARNPFTNRWTDDGIRLDVPTYRQQRIFFPLLAWMLSFGSAAALPSVFLLINIASIGLLAWSCAALAEEAGANAWWSVAAWMYPGWVLSISRDCAEILEVALLITAIYAVRRKRIALATVLATCAILTKETALLAIAAFAPSAPALLIAIVAHFALKFSLFYVWHAAPSLGTGRFSLLGAFQSSHTLLTNLEIGALLLLAVIAFRSWRRAPLLYLLAFALYIPLLAVLDASFWVEDWSFMRAATEYWVFGGLLGAFARNRVAVALSVAMTCALAAHVVLIRF